MATQLRYPVLNPGGHWGQTQLDSQRTLHRKALPRIIVLAFYAFVVSIPFETVGSEWHPGTLAQQTGSVMMSVSRIGAIAFALTCLLKPRITILRVSKVTIAMAWFLTFFVIRSLFVDAIVKPEPWAVLNSLVLVQIVVFLHLFTNVVRAYPQMYRTAGWLLGGGCAMLAALQAIGVGRVENAGNTARVTSFGEDPNMLAGKLAIGLVFIAGLVLFGEGPSRRIARIGRLLFLLASAGVMIPAIARSGSRGALVALAIGMTAIGIRYLRTARGVGLLGGVAVFGAVAAVTAFSIATNPVIMKRLTDTVHSGEAAGRDTIYPFVIQEIIQRPIIGWGQGKNMALLADRLGGESEIKSTENTYLWSLSGVGIFGSLPFFGTIFYAGLCGWRLRRTQLGWTPFAVFLTTFVVSNFCEWYQEKVFWLVIGITIATGECMKGASRRKLVEQLPRVERVGRGGI